MEVGRIGQGGPINIAVKSEVSTETSVVTAAPVVVQATEDTNKSSNNSNGEKENPTKEETQKAVEKLNKFLEGENIHAEYAVHEKFGDIMIKIVNTDTKQVILEVPPKKILDMIAKMMETVGIFLDKKA
jgi:flagellar protein FlaG